MKNVCDAVEKLISYAERNLGLAKKDEDFVRNNIFALLSLESFDVAKKEYEEDDLNAVTAELADSVVENGLAKEEEIPTLIDRIIGLTEKSPSELQKEFYETEKKYGSKRATEEFYDYCVKTDYVKKKKLDENPRFSVGDLIITINKAKPEFKDPKKAVSGNAVKGGYPKCTICHENEGFAGRQKCTLRTIDITLDGQKWFWQFSPYGYFYQHGIAVNYEHIPMHVDKRAFYRLMDFADRFPHYFIGCNASLPRIGGSVLAHDHYQGGGEVLPLHKAEAYKTFVADGAVIEIVDWYGTVVRVVSENRDITADVCDKIRIAWENYSNPEIGLINVDEEGVHHAVSPTVVKTARGYETSLILRSNITSDEYTDGVFHAHPEFHVIKKESIGLIEAQGLFILPGRLEKQLSEVKEYILKGEPLPEDLKEFKTVYDETVNSVYGALNAVNVDEAMKKELASVCARILDNTAVFKDKEQTVAFLKDAGII